MSIVRNAVTLTFASVSEAERRADYWRHEGNYEEVKTFVILDGENKGRTAVHAIHVTEKKGKN